MRGLKTQEGIKFEAFFQLVQAEARRQNSVFFLECGEGRELVRDDLEGEYLSGWLVPIAQADAFESVWLQSHENALGTHWSRYIRFAVWRGDDRGIQIDFREF